MDPTPAQGTLDISNNAVQPPAAPPAPAQTAAPAAQPPASPPPPPPPATVRANGDVVIKLPEGAKVNEQRLSAFKSLAQKHGLSSQQAQAIVDDALASSLEDQKSLDATIAKQRQADLEALKADKDFGGAKYDQTVKQAQSAMRQFFGEETAKLFAALGVDNHPALVKGLARIRQAIAEDSIAGTVQPGARAKTEEDRLRQMMPTSYDQIVGKK